LKPAVIIRNQGTGLDPFIVPRSLAFDAIGDLWISDGSKRGIMEFLPNQIAHSGGPTPSIFITAPDFVPTVMRFDDSNNLWVARFQSQSNPYQLWRFSPADRSASGTPNPGLVVDLPDGLGSEDLAFDRSGNLWTAGGSFHGDVIEMFRATDLNTTGEISPLAAVSITSSSFGSVNVGSCLGGIDFDRFGALWLSVGVDNADCSANQQVIEFTSRQLNGGGDLAPSVVIAQNSDKSNLFFPGPIRFGPKLK
jgi:hypothetical protein